MFFHCRISEDFMRSLETMPPGEQNADQTTYMDVASTKWVNLRDPAGRKSFAQHFIELSKWAKTIVGETDEES